MGGTPNFTYEDEDNSIIEYDVSGTTVTGGRLIHSLIASPSGEVNLSDFNDLILSGETLTVSAQVISGAAAVVTTTINWDEEI